MIKYSGNTINDWWRSSSAITKMMYNGNQAYRRKVRVLPTRWVVDDTSYLCVSYDKYEKEVKEYSLDDGVTWTKYIPEISRPGDLIFSGSVDCGAAPQERWVVDSSSYICDGYDKYAKEVKQYCLDDYGINWANYVPEISRKGNLIKQNSRQCGYTADTQEPCYVVVDTIVGYSDTEFVDVFNKADNSWYKLNNLNQFEKYGVYGRGRTIPYYEGKLTIDGDYEYIYSGSSWVNVGEVSGSSRVPVGYTEVEYIQNTGTSYLDTAITVKGTYKIEAEMQQVTETNYGRLFGCGTWDGAYGLQFDYQDYSGIKCIHMHFFGTSDWNYNTSFAFDYLKHTYTYNDGVFSIDSSQAGASTSSTDYTAQDNLGVFTYINNGRPSDSGYWGEEHMKGKMYSFKIWDENDTLVRDLVPCVKDSDDTVGAYDIVNDVFYTVPTGYTTDKLIAGAETGTTEYPIYYDVMQAPPSALTFSSMQEAEDYECPYVGVTATISGTDYIFDENYLWVTKYQWVTVPNDYTCVSGDKYSKLEKQQRNVDDTWTSLGIYSPGTLIESASTDCQVSDFCYSYTVNGETTTVDCETETYIPHERFRSVNIDSAEVGSCCQSIGAYAFDSCPLTSLTINDGVTDIDHEAFQDAGNLTTLTIPSTVTGSSFWVFARMTACTEVIFECSAPPTNTAGWGAQFHDWYPPVVYVPDAALSTFRNAGFDYWIDGTNPPASIDDWIRPISER